MTPSEPTVWDIHAGKTGDAETLFMEHYVVFRRRTRGGTHR